jgi:hypothetical protein
MMRGATKASNSTRLRGEPLSDLGGVPAVGQFQPTIRRE